MPPCGREASAELADRGADYRDRHVRRSLGRRLFVSAPFLLGLVTQAPFALLAAAVAFALASAAQRVAHVLRRALGRRLRPIDATSLSWVSIDPPVEPELARGYASRGPPLVA